MEVFCHLVPGRHANRQASQEANQERRAHQQLKLRLQCRQVFWTPSGGPVGGPEVPVIQDPMMMQVLRQQMLLTQSMVDFL